MSKILYWSVFKKSVCPWCGRKWIWTRARRSLLKKNGEFDFSCKCGKQWKVIQKEEGFSYIEQ